MFRTVVVVNIILIAVLSMFATREPFYNPNYPDERQETYPDQQNADAELIEAQKYVQIILDSRKLNSVQTAYFQDLLNLLQFI
jgi:hypothetical protein